MFMNKSETFFVSWEQKLSPQQIFRVGTKRGGGRRYLKGGACLVSHGT